MTDETIDKEFLIEQIAEIRAAVGVSNYLMVTLLEKIGDGDEVMIVNTLAPWLADTIENDLRAKAGLPPRDKPRPPLMDEVERKNAKPFDWTKAGVN